MTARQAAKALENEVQKQRRRAERMMNTRLPRAANALRNAELSVLSGNKSPSPPGSPPGRRTGYLRNSWTVYHKNGTPAGMFGIISGAHYAGYLESGTRKMAARPFVDKIIEKAMPRIEKIFSEIGG